MFILQSKYTFLSGLSPKIVYPRLMHRMSVQIIILDDFIL